MLWCVSVAPLGDPVVPLVNWILTGSSNCSVAASAASVPRWRAPPIRATSSKGIVPGQAGPPIWITARSCGSRAACRSPGGDFASSGSSVFSISDIVAGLERGRGDERGAADLVQREFEFAQPIGGIDGDQDQPGLGGGELRQRPFRPVGRPDADPRAALEAEREKARGQRVDPLGEFLPGPAHAVARRNQRLAIAPAPGGEIEAAPDGVAQQRRIGDAANIAIGFFGQVLFSIHRSMQCEEFTREHPSALLSRATVDARRRRVICVLMPPSAPASRPA